MKNILLLPGGTFLNPNQDRKFILKNLIFDHIIIRFETTATKQDSSEILCKELKKEAHRYNFFVQGVSQCNYNMFYVIIAIYYNFSFGYPT